MLPKLGRQGFWSLAAPLGRLCPASQTFLGPRLSRRFFLLWGLQIATPVCIRKSGPASWHAGSSVPVHHHALHSWLVEFSDLHGCSQAAVVEMRPAFFCAPGCKSRSWAEAREQTSRKYLAATACCHAKVISAGPAAWLCCKEGFVKDRPAKPISLPRQYDYCNCWCGQTRFVLQCMFFTTCSKSCFLGDMC